MTDVSQEVATKIRRRVLTQELSKRRGLPGTGIGEIRSSLGREISDDRQDVAWLDIITLFDFPPPIRRAI